MSFAIKDEVVQAAFDILNDHRDSAGALRAQQARTEYKVKAVLARLYRASPESSVEAKKMWAITQPDYETACEAHCKAIEAWENYRDRKEDAKVICEAWRTSSANERDAGRFR